VIVADSNILSSFAAAKGLPLLFKALQEEVIYIPPSVHRELSAGLEYGVSYLIGVVDLVEGNQLRILELTEQEQEQTATLSGSFGAGEKEAIAVCLQRGATLLCNEKRVVNYCLQHNIPCFNLKALLRFLWKKGVVSKAKVKTMIVRMNKVEGLVFKTTKEIFAD